MGPTKSHESPRNHSPSSSAPTGIDSQAFCASAGADLTFKTWDGHSSAHVTKELGSPHFLNGGYEAPRASCVPGPMLSVSQVISFKCPRDAIRGNCNTPTEQLRNLRLRAGELHSIARFKCEMPVTCPRSRPEHREPSLQGQRLCRQPALWPKGSCKPTDGWWARKQQPWKELGSDRSPSFHI